MNFVIYARKSTDEEDRKLPSIEARLAELREFSRKESLHVVREFVESRTAKMPGRPVFNEMMHLIDESQAEGIIAWRLRERPCSQGPGHHEGKAPLSVPGSHFAGNNNSPTWTQSMTVCLMSSSIKPSRGKSTPAGRSNISTRKDFSRRS